MLDFFTQLITELLLPRSEAASQQDTTLVRIPVKVSRGITLIFPALGAGSTSSSYPVIYGFFTVDSVTALFKTEDAGVNWQMISDAAHGFAASAANVVAADISIYGR